LGNLIAEEKVLELAEKYKELKKLGKIDNYLAKKRKKQLSKDSKHLNKHVNLS
jgi:ribosomal RNA-processing protein 36